ncbi:CHZ domain-containing protein [Cephalotus follicularis]|uniref:CHZ domain-containing protein n=1 Tax=Cephalotus follicularis TaxID=3775 RepID=A0A1Q3CV51_CEPFO|nr:CHZ domain-containing protein [Cephalotus follicularis]
MAELAPDSETLAKDINDSTLDNHIESQIHSAMHSRIPYFKKEADSLTLEGVRRLLEKDLEMEEFSLDVHKRFVKECMVECIAAAEDDNGSKNSGETGETIVCSSGGEANGCSPKGGKSGKFVKESSSEDEEKMNYSPVLGLLDGGKTIKAEAKEAQSVQNKEIPSETTVARAIRKRASYIKANSDKVTMAGLRRLLEEDLKLEKLALDPYKKFISEKLDEKIASYEVSEPATGVRKKNLKKSSLSKASKKLSSEESSEAACNGSDEEEDELNPKKKIIAKGKIQKSEGIRKRIRSEKDTKVSNKKRIKPEASKSEDNSDPEDSGVDSEDGHSRSSTEKPVKKKDVSTPAYGKRVEHLKSVIKACGLSVPPSVYKKVKQVPENKRESHLMKELEEMLSREGLSSNPTEKEIKDVRKRKERAKELEGIDMSNIVSSSRRRSTISFVAPPKPKIPDESGGDDTEDSDDEDKDDDDEDNDADGGDDDSQSEDLNEDKEDSE